MYDDDFDREVLILASERNPDLAFFPGDDDSDPYGRSDSTWSED